MGRLSNGSGPGSSATGDVVDGYFPVQPPDPRSNAYGPPSDVRRDFSAPPQSGGGPMGRSQTPGRNFAYPMQPQRSATAPVPDYVRQGMQRSQTAGPGGQWR